MYVNNVIYNNYVFLQCGRCCQISINCYGSRSVARLHLAFETSTEILLRFIYCTCNRIFTMLQSIRVCGQVAVNYERPRLTAVGEKRERKDTQRDTIQERK